MEDENIEVLTFAIMGNIFNLAYNIPFVYTIVKNKSGEIFQRFF